MKANDYQVGGKHYRTSFQHWDLMLKLRIGYLEAATTKYVTRWRQKGQGVDDLKKSLHYLNKLEEDGYKPVRHLPFDEIVKEVTAFNDANKLSDLERAYVLTLCTWQEKDDLNGARELLLLLLDEAEALEREITDPAPVPLEEENHYAERSEDGW